MEEEMRLSGDGAESALRAHPDHFRLAPTHTFSLSLSLFSSYFLPLYPCILRDTACRLSVLVPFALNHLLLLSA